MAILNEAQHKIVSDAVAQAELQTSGEIVTVLADRSDGYTDVALVWAVAAAFTAMTIFALFPDFFLSKIDWLFSGGWGAQWTLGQTLSIMIGFGLLKFVGILVIMLWDPIKFAFIPNPVKMQRVHNRAIGHFKVGAERRTHGHTGILIYLSMKEHRAEIIADLPIAEKVDAEVWGAAMADMLVHVKQGNIAEGIAAGVHDVGIILSEHFPRAEDDQNELPDRLIEL